MGLLDDQCLCKNTSHENSMARKVSQKETQAGKMTRTEVPGQVWGWGLWGLQGGSTVREVTFTSKSLNIKCACLGTPMCFSGGYYRHTKEFTLSSEGMGRHQEVLNRESWDFLCVFMNHPKCWVDNRIIGNRGKGWIWETIEQLQSWDGCVWPEGTEDEEKGAIKDMFLYIIWIGHKDLYIMGIRLTKENWRQWWTLKEGIF